MGGDGIGQFADPVIAVLAARCLGERIAHRGQAGAVELARKVSEQIAPLGIAIAAIAEPRPIDCLRGEARKLTGALHLVDDGIGVGRAQPLEPRGDVVHLVMRDGVEPA